MTKKRTTFSELLPKKLKPVRVDERTVIYVRPNVTNEAAIKRFKANIEKTRHHSEMTPAEKRLRALADKMKPE